MSVLSKNTVAGVDGAQGRWVVALFDGDGIRWTLEDDVAAVLAVTADCIAVGVDMPLSMPDTGYRLSEIAAKKFLGPARSSIFHTPVAAVLDCDTYTEACEASRAITGKAISKQTWFLLPGVRAWRSAQFDAERVAEVHPECSFRTMAPNVAFASKKSGRGAGQRLAALHQWLNPQDVSEGLANLPLGLLLDDALDAAAAAWSARRFSRGEHRAFGNATAPDRIVA